MSQRRKVLLLTDSEYGQANIFLATCYALMGAAPDVEIHLASFIPIKAAVAAASEAGMKTHPDASPVKSHEIHGTCYFMALLSPEVGGRQLLEITPSFQTMPIVLRIIARAAMPYTGPEIVENQSTGVLQVVLPVWADTYDFAQRVEYLGIEKWGSPTTAPRYQAKERGDAMKQVIIGPNSRTLLDRAKRLAERRGQLGEGRDVAAKYIIENILD